MGQVKILRPLFMLLSTWPLNLKKLIIENTNYELICFINGLEIAYSKEAFQKGN